MGWDGAPRGSVELEERGQERLTGFDITVATKIRSWRRLVALSLNLSLSLSQDTGQVGGSNWAGICVCVCGGGGAAEIMAVLAPLPPIRPVAGSHGGGQETTIFGGMDYGRRPCLNQVCHSPLLDKGEVMMWVHTFPTLHSALNEFIDHGDLPFASRERRAILAVR